ncbi:DUF881 domain-containing protein [Fusibacter ferrireducens]|uniref:DUF881 domain-containing protein n=1 Tax=Fusibacter ferrireducens TaxID=2785058 RepID=A0ABR9ZNA8_9FIRM|nr:DUF881 domain-containing protein [Fusibacter ferrireducens]MBF4691608.1 DUF881 domain-containing protein [Fusibacter ferrireducens]
MKLTSFQKKMFALTVLLGILSTMQFRAVNSGYKYMSIKEMYANSIELESQNAELVQLRAKADSLKVKIDEFQKARTDVSIDYENVLQLEIENTKKVAGLTNVEGPGIVIIVTDGTRELYENERPDVVTVHDIDIRAMVDDLRNAGAEAISINDQRVIFNKSEIQCTGPTIKINDQVFAVPFVIKAIGDRKYLESAINEPGSFSESLRKWGVFVEVNTSINVSIPAYEGTMENQYAIQ